MFVKCCLIALQELELANVLSNADASALSNAFYGQGTGPILLDDVACTGTQTNILQCTFDTNTADCGHSEDAGVQCQIQSEA